MGALDSPRRIDGDYRVSGISNGVRMKIKKEKRFRTFFWIYKPKRTKKKKIKYKIIIKDNNTYSMLNFNFH